MKSGLLSLVLPDDHVRKITCPCPFCTHKYERTSGFFGICPLSANSLVFTTMKQKKKKNISDSENIVRKTKAGSHHFLLCHNIVVDHFQIQFHTLSNILFLVCCSFEYGSLSKLSVLTHSHTF